MCDTCRKWVNICLCWSKGDQCTLYVNPQRCGWCDHHFLRISGLRVDYVNMPPWENLAEVWDNGMACCHENFSWSLGWWEWLATSAQNCWRVVRLIWHIDPFHSYIRQCCASLATGRSKCFDCVCPKQFSQFLVSVWFLVQNAAKLKFIFTVWMH